MGKSEGSVLAGPNSAVIKYIDENVPGDPGDRVLQLRDAYLKVGSSLGMWRDKLLFEDRNLEKIKALLGKDWGVVPISMIRNLCTSCAKRPDKFGGGWGATGWRSERVRKAEKSGYKLIIWRERDSECFRLSHAQFRILQAVAPYPEGLLGSQIIDKAEAGDLDRNLGPGPKSGVTGIDEIKAIDDERGQPSLLGMGLVIPQVSDEGGKDVTRYVITPQGKSVLKLLNEHGD